MASFNNGKLKGKLGNLVAFEQHGKTFLRRAPIRTAPPTEAELKNRYILELVSQWLKPITPFVRQGFRNYSFNFEGFSAAFSVLYKEALHRNGYESHIDPSLVKVSHGDLGLPDNLQLSLSPEKILEFSWSPAVNNTQGPRDRSMLLAYNIEQQQAWYTLMGPIRYKGSASLSLAQALPGTYHIYIAFVAEDGSRQSNSAYLGNYEL